MTVNESNLDTCVFQNSINEKQEGFSPGFSYNHLCLCKVYYFQITHQGSD